MDNTRKDRAPCRNTLPFAVEIWYMLLRKRAVGSQTHRGPADRLPEKTEGLNQPEFLF